MTVTSSVICSPRTAADTSARPDDQEPAGPGVRRPKPDVTAGLRRQRPWHRSAALREVALAAALYVAYSFSRTLGDPTLQEATGTAHQILAIQQAVGLDVEAAANRWLMGVPVLAVTACYFYACLHYVVTPAVLVWMFARHRERYASARTVLVLSSGLALVGFALLPTAPPRLVDGYTDVLAAYSGWGWWGQAASAPDGLAWLTNQYAAMPSLHVGWAVWCGALLFLYAPRPGVRAAGIAYPLLTALVVVATGNHYVLDVVAGVLVIAASAALLRWRSGSAIRDSPVGPALGHHPGHEGVRPSTRLSALRPPRPHCRGAAWRPRSPRQRVVGIGSARRHE